MTSARITLCLIPFFLSRSNGFNIGRPNRVGGLQNQVGLVSTNFRESVILFESNEEQEKKDDEIERLRSMAAALRADAAKLEAGRQEEIATAAQRAFEKFDVNKDGEISLLELKAGLEKELKLELSEKRVQQLMDDFDKSGDGVLQLDEFVGVSQFRNRLEQMARDERKAASNATQQAKKEEAAATALKAQLDLVNDKPPTLQEKAISILPYLFPLLDGVQFGKYILLENPDNVFVAAIAILFGLFRSIPFSGLIAFFALNFLSGNLKINRLIRFNMQQAIFLDIALFFPGLLGALYGILFSGVAKLPESVTVLSSDAIFFTLLIAVAYCTGSSLLGYTPDKIPVISNAVEQRMPSYDNMGMLVTKEEDKKEDEKKDKK